MPKRRDGEAYWSEDQFRKLVDADAAPLESAGPMPWRLLAYMLDADPEIAPLREFVSKRLLPPAGIEKGLKQLHRMLMTLDRAGYVRLLPRPPLEATSDEAVDDAGGKQADEANAQNEAASDEAAPALTLGQSTKPAFVRPAERKADANSSANGKSAKEPAADYKPERIEPTPQLEELTRLRGVNPLFGRFVIHQLGIADRNERIQAIECLLEMAGSVAKSVRVPHPERMPLGPLATERLHDLLLQYGLVPAERLALTEPTRNDDPKAEPGQELVFPMTLAEKLLTLFRYEFPGVDVKVTSVWCVGEVLEFGDFNKYVVAKGLQKQEGVVFRHLLRTILMCDEFAQIVPPEVEEDDWYDELDGIADRLTEICGGVDPDSTQETLDQIELRKKDPATP